MTIAYTQVINNTKDLIFLNGSTPLGNVNKSFGAGCTVYISNSDGTNNPSGNYVTIQDNANQLFTALYSDVTNPASASAAALQSTINGYIGVSGAIVTQAAITAALGLAPNATNLGTDSGGNIIVTSGGGGSGVTTIGTIDSQTAASNGAVISGVNLVLQSASVSNPGLVNNTTQSFSGVKTMANTTLATSATAGGFIVSGGISIAKNIYYGGALTATQTVDGRGTYFNQFAGTYADSTTSATLQIIASHSIGIPTFVGANITVNTGAATLYIAGDPVVTGLHTPAPTAYGLINSGKTNLIGAVTVGGTLSVSSLLSPTAGLTVTGGATSINRTGAIAGGGFNTFGSTTTASSGGSSSALVENNFIINYNSTTSTTTPFSTISGIGIGGGVAGLCSVININNSGSVTANQNFVSLVNFTSTGNVVDHVGYMNQTATKSSSGTITGNNVGFWADDQTEGANIYGFRSRVSAGANKYNAFFEGSAGNFFAGPVGMGTNYTANALEIVGGTSFDMSGNMTVGSTFNMASTGTMIDGSGNVTVAGTFSVTSGISNFLGLTAFNNSTQFNFDNNMTFNGTGLVLTQSNGSPASFIQAINQDNPSWVPASVGGLPAIISGVYGINPAFLLALPNTWFGIKLGSANYIIPAYAV